VIVVVVDPDSCLVDVRHFFGLLAGREPSWRRMSMVSIVVVDVVVVVGEGCLLDWTAFEMQVEFGWIVVESIAVKLTYVRDWMMLETLLQIKLHVHQFNIPHATQAVRPGDSRDRFSQQLRLTLYEPMILDMALSALRIGENFFAEVFWPR
jgi:hypothetical protein